MSTRICLRLESVSGIFSKKSIIASDCIQPWAICRQRSSSSRFFQPVHLNWLCHLRDAVQDGNLCERCEKEITEPKAQHKQTKYCEPCAEIKKKENTHPPY